MINAFVHYAALVP